MDTHFLLSLENPLLPGHHMSGHLDGLNRLSLPPQQLCLDGLSASLLSLAGVVLEQVVHLFESPPACLRNEEERPDERQKAKDGEEDVSTVASLLDKWRGDETLLFVSILTCKCEALQWSGAGDSQ